MQRVSDFMPLSSPDVPAHPFFSRYSRTTKANGAEVLTHLSSGRSVTLTAGEKREMAMAAETLTCVLASMRQDGCSPHAVAKAEQRLLERLTEAYGRPFARASYAKHRAGERPQKTIRQVHEVKPSASQSRELTPEQNALVTALAAKKGGALTVCALARKTDLQPVTFVRALGELSRANLIRMRGASGKALALEAAFVSVAAANARDPKPQTMWREYLAALADQETEGRKNAPERLKVATATVRLSSFAAQRCERR